MDKKLIAVLVIVAIILCGIGAYAYTNMNAAKFGSSSVSIPGGFKVKDSKDAKASNTTILTNGKTTYYINENHNKSIDDIISDYKTKHANDTVVQKTSKVGNVSVETLTLKQENKTVHSNYYYQKNGKIYHIFFTGKNNETAFNKLVNSTKKKTLPV